MNVRVVRGRRALLMHARFDPRSSARKQFAVACDEPAGDEVGMDRMMDMRALVGVVDSGTFNGAAKRLKVSPAMITSHINSLEERLGIQLLSRTTRKVNLTEAGRTFY